MELTTRITFNHIDHNNLFFLFKHFKHAVRDDEAANHVECAEQYSQETQHKCQIVVAVRMTHHDDGADDDDPVYGIGARHKWCVQDGRYVGNYLDAQQNGQDDDVDNGLILKEKLCHMDRLWTLDVVLWMLEK